MDKNLERIFYDKFTWATVYIEFNKPYVDPTTQAWFWDPELNAIEVERRWWLRAFPRGYPDVFYVEYDEKVNSANNKYDFSKEKGWW